MRMYDLIEKKKRGGALFRWVVRPLALFVGCMAVATAIELVTSYILEALTGAWPWQTYVDYAINFQGRIALSPSIRFGLGGLLFLLVLQPLFEKLVEALGSRRKIVFWVLVVIFALDIVATVALSLG